MDVKMPDGTIVKNVPEGTTQEDLLASYNAHKMNAGAKKPSAASDVAKSVATAPLKAAANIVGLPSTAMDLIAAGARKAGGALGLDTRFAYPTIPNLGGMAREGFSALGLGHQPQTTAGRYAGAAVEGAFSAPTNPSTMLTGIGAGVGAEAGGERYGAPGAVLGGVLGGVATGKAIQPLQNTLNAEQKAVVERAKEMGMKLTPGQQTGSRRMQAFENTTEAMPGGGYLAQQRANNQKIAVEAAAKAIGEKSGELSPNVLANAADRIGSEFERLTKGRQIKLDSKFFDDVKAIAAEQAKLAEPDSGVMNTLKKWMQPQGTSNVAIGSDVYQANRSVYAAEARQGFGSQTSTQAARAKQALVKALDDAAERSLPPKDLMDFKKARVQWANLEALEAADLAKTGYNVSPNSLANALRSQNKKVGRIPLGERDLVDVSRMGSLLRDATPNSGTPERAMWMHFLSGGLGAGLGGSAAGVPGAVAGLAASYALPAVAQRTIMLPVVNPYLSGGLMSGYQPTPALLELIRAGELAQNPSR